MKTITLAEARAAGLIRYFTGAPCRRGHIAERYTNGATCVQCLYEHRAQESARGDEKYLSQHQRKTRGLIEDARTRGEKHYNTGKPCRNGHIAPRLISTGNCIACGPERDRRFRENRPDYFQAPRVKARNAKNAKLRRSKDPQKARDDNLRWMRNNPEASRQKTAKWRRSHPGESRAQWIARKLRERNAIPRWASLKAIRSIYRESARRSKTEGVSYHVDHIVPLRHRLVCGLHCEANLQVLTAIENLSKRNSYWPDMP